MYYHQIFHFKFLVKTKCRKELWEHSVNVNLKVASLRKYEATKIIYVLPEWRPYKTNVRY